MRLNITVIFILIASIFSAGCLSESTIPIKDIVFDIKPAELTMKSGDSAQVMIRVTNNGKTTIHPFVRFNMNASDRQYIRFINESYDIGSLRPGEDSGFRIVDFRAELAAGKEIKYPVRVQVINDGKVLENKDIVITVTR